MTEQELNPELPRDWFAKHDYANGIVTKPGQESVVVAAAAVAGLFLYPMFRQ